ncbi:alpha/beta hydrolase fold family protein [Xylogone sp. PMI_703]|nr:alpha/beta hydrolase fold family protein [Xylogone sp. PMI_703]
MQALSKPNVRLHQTLALRDGRLLGFAEYGSPTAFPVLYFHGFPSSRLEGCGFGNIPQKHGIRLIVPDRPGFGLSSFQPHRRITDWPADVKALASHLGLSRFAILGCSGGGPYAVACAHALPSDMLSTVGVVAGAGPWTAGTQDVTLTRRLMAPIAMYWPAGLEALSNMLIRMLRYIVNTDFVTRRLDNWIDSMRREKKKEKGDEDEEEIKNSTRKSRERVIAMTLEAFAQGSAAMIQETQLLIQDWGFRFEDVTYEGIQIWHGTRDQNSPVRMIRYMAERLPRSILREFDEDHYTMGHHLEEILSELVPEAATKCGSKGPL